MKEEKITKEEQNTDAATIAAINADFTSAYKAKQSKESLFKEINRRYRSYTDSSTATTRSTLFIPESFKVVETVAPRLTARKPSFKAIPRKASAITKADSIGYLLDYRYDVMGLQRKIKIYVKHGLKYGTGMVKMGWDSNKMMPTADPIDIADLFPDAETYDWQDGFIIHRFYREKHELENSPIGYKNLDQLNLKDDTETTTDNDTLRQDRKAIQGVGYDNKRSGVECLEWWGRVKGELRVRTLANRSVLIRDEKNPNPLDLYPFVPFFDQEVDFDKWGIGEIEPILDLQDEENTTRRQRIDEKNLSIHNMWVVSKLAGIDYRNIVSRPGGIILANDINGIKPLDKQNITMNSIEEVRMIKEDIKETTGVNDYITGATGRESTATESAIKSQESNQRFMDKANNLEISLKQIGKWICALDAAFLTEDLKVQILGKFGMEEKIIPIKDIRDEYDIDIESGSSLPSNPDLRRMQLRELLQVITPILSNPMGIPDGLREFMRTLIQAYDFKNTDEILQGAQHPLVKQAIAALDKNELNGVNPQIVEEEIKRMLTGSGALNSQLPQGGSPMEGQKQPAMTGTQLQNPNIMG